ncbi:MAG: hypothetical protein Q9186_004345 [Xanthomendoza sp. 1 TL-2023]
MRILSHIERYPHSRAKTGHHPLRGSLDVSTLKPFAILFTRSETIKHGLKLDRPMCHRQEALPLGPSPILFVVSIGPSARWAWRYSFAIFSPCLSELPNWIAIVLGLFRVPKQQQSIKSECIFQAARAIEQLQRRPKTVNDLRGVAFESSLSIIPRLKFYLLFVANGAPCCRIFFSAFSIRAQALSDLSIEQRQLAFQHWVAYDLYGHNNQHLGSHLKCPLIGCSIIFDSLESCLAHLTGCAWLANSWYWCPFCRKAEQFAVPEPTLTSDPKAELASGVVDPTNLSTRRTSKGKSTTTRFWRHIGNKLGFLSQHPMAQSSKSIGLAELDSPNLPWNGSASARTCTMSLDKSSSMTVNEDPLPAQYSSFGHTHPSDVWFSPEELRYQVAEIDSIQRSELMASQLWTGWIPKTLELASSGDSGLDHDYPYEPTNVESSMVHARPTHQGPLSELPTNPADEPYFGPALDFVNLPHSLSNLPIYQQAPLYQTTPGLDMPQKSSRDPEIGESNAPTASSLGGPEYSFPVEMPASIPNVQQTNLSYGGCRPQLNKSLPDPPLVDVNRSSALDNLQSTLSQRHQEMVRCPSHQWSFTMGPTSTDTSVDQVYPLWHEQGPRPIVSMCTSIGRLPRYHQGHRLLPQDSRLVSPISTPELSAPGLHKERLYSSPDSSFVSPLTESDFDTNGCEHEGPSVGSVNMIRPCIKTCARTDYQQIACSLPIVSEKVFKSGEQACVANSPSSSSAKRSHHSSLTSMMSSSTDSTRSSNTGSNSTQATSTEVSPVSPSTAPSFQPTATSQTLDEPDVTKCPKCSKLFHGTLSDRKSNLHRHLQYCHGQGKRFKCPTDGCKKDYSRPDNVIKHRRDIHQGLPALQRSNARQETACKLANASLMFYFDDFTERKKVFAAAGSTHNSTLSHFRDASDPNRRSGSSSINQMKNWQQTSHPHEQVATGQNSERKIPREFMKETAGTREDARRFGRDCDRLK